MAADYVAEPGPEMTSTCGHCGRPYSSHRYVDDLCPGPTGHWSDSAGTTFKRAATDGK